MGEQGDGSSDGGGFDEVAAGEVHVTAAEKKVKGETKPEPVPVPEGFDKWTGNGTGPSAPPVKCPACGSLIQPHLIDHEVLR